MMSRLLAHAPVPARALDALDVTRARRNGRKARRNCGCGPGCGCAPCMAKWGPLAKNPRQKSWGVGIVPAEAGPGYPDVFEVSPGSAIPWGSPWGGYTFTEGPFPTRAGATTWARVWKVGNKVKNPRQNGAERASGTHARKEVREMVSHDTTAPYPPEIGKGIRVHDGWLFHVTFREAKWGKQRGFGPEYDRWYHHFDQGGTSLVSGDMARALSRKARKNGTVGGLVAGAAAMHVAHRAGWMKNGRAARRNHHLRAGDRVRFKGAAGQGLGTGVVVREVDPARDLYAVQWEGGQRHASIDGHLLVKVRGNPAKDSYYVILVDTSGREHMIGPMKLRDAKDRLHREEGKGYIPDGTGGRTLLKYGSGFVKHASAVLSSALLKYRNPR